MYMFNSACIFMYILCRPREDRVDWLYKGPGTINREEYLLGKPIDKAIDPTLIEEQREKEVKTIY